ncbi:MAG: hypothetical protein NXI04_00875 [Planctomycetaceae bacterium]|nr:hypothetical protein [Planctomycetaceae bacterium]
MPESQDPYAVGSDQAVIVPLERDISAPVAGVSIVAGLLLSWSFVIQAIIWITDTPCAMGSQFRFLSLVMLQLVLWVGLAWRGVPSLATLLLFLFCAVIQTPGCVMFIGRDTDLPFTPGWLAWVASEPLIWLVPNALATLTGLALWPKLRQSHQARPAK